jgi:hypothetical protein
MSSATARSRRSHGEVEQVDAIHLENLRPTSRPEVGFFCFSDTMKPLPRSGTRIPETPISRFQSGFTAEPRSISRRPRQIPRPPNPPRAHARGERGEGVCSFAEGSEDRSLRRFVRTCAGCRSEAGPRNAPSDLAVASRGPVPGRGRLRRRGTAARGRWIRGRSEGRPRGSHGGRSRLPRSRGRGPVTFSLRSPRADSGEIFRCRATWAAGQFPCVPRANRSTRCSWTVPAIPANLSGAVGRLTIARAAGMDAGRGAPRRTQRVR